MSEREVRLSDFLNKKQIEQLEEKTSSPTDHNDESISVRVLKGSLGQRAEQDYESIADFILKRSENTGKYKFKRTGSKHDFDVKKIENNSQSLSDEDAEPQRGAQYKFKRTAKYDFDVKNLEENQDYFNLSELKSLYNKLNPENKLQDLYKDLSNNIFIILEAKRNIEDIKIKMLNLYKERYPNLSEEDIKKTLLTWY